MRAEYVHCPNLTIIDTPGFVLKVAYPYLSLWALESFTYCSAMYHIEKLNSKTVDRQKKENQRTLLMKFFQW